jgi:hypothetical protein
VRPVVERELEDPLVLDVLEVLLPEVDDGGAVGDVVAQQRAGRLREQDLAAAAGGADTRRADDVEAEVALFSDCRLARVEPHPHAHVRVVGPVVLSQRALCVDGAGDRIPRPRERVEERVALRVDLAPAMLLERLAHDPAVIPHDVAVPVAELLKQTSRALDVSEKERNGARGKRAHAGNHFTVANRSARSAPAHDYRADIARAPRSAPSHPSTNNAPDGTFTRA